VGGGGIPTLGKPVSAAVAKGPAAGQRASGQEEPE